MTQPAPAGSPPGVGQWSSPDSPAPAGAGAALASSAGLAGLSPPAEPRPDASARGAAPEGGSPAFGAEGCGLPHAPTARSAASPNAPAMRARHGFHDGFWIKRSPPLTNHVT
ncbi:hypothetical protein ACMHYB_38985 [Sorangium sp. So ce1128]